MATASRGYVVMPLQRPTATLALDPLLAFVGAFLSAEGAAIAESAYKTTTGVVNLCGFDLEGAWPIADARMQVSVYQREHHPNRNHPFDRNWGCGSPKAKFSFANFL